MALLEKLLGSSQTPALSEREEKLQKIITSNDVPSVIKVMKDLVLKAYGEKSEDGRRFIKNDKLREEFSQTEAYSVIFMKLAMDSDAAAKFANGIIPADLADEVAKQDLQNHPALR